ncbi:hypothetical protein EG328_011995 [Venturia inaequalis]|nr:hypothetical protein EG328_011995 [Venturia inaequalis]KAE9993256.1 hypothetical protein EG327_005863 [Venturia inaequalis]RDI88049.1 hypothetical protein Vi05172_g2043 [Venturia inaequalis]
MNICPACGIDCDADQRSITELQAQVNLLSEKATSAADKLADYEDEIRRLKCDFSADLNTGQHATSETTPPATEGVPTSGVFPGRLAALIGGKRPSSIAPTPIPTDDRSSSASSRRESDLAAALAKEHELRQKAEGQANQMSVEIEELSVTLFQQANDMVAEERRARAKLEERIEILEKRDTEKRQRLERLEGALKRIERVRGMLSP